MLFIFQKLYSAIDQNHRIIANNDLSYLNKSISVKIASHTKLVDASDQKL